MVDENASVAAIYDYLTGSWVRGEDGSVALVMAVDEPKGKTEELAKVKDVLGTFTTSYSTSGCVPQQKRCKWLQPDQRNNFVSRRYVFYL